jgi:hypothetical protein
MEMHAAALFVRITDRIWRDHPQPLRGKATPAGNRPSNTHAARLSS